MRRRSEPTCNFSRTHCRKASGCRTWLKNSAWMSTRCAHSWHDSVIARPRSVEKRRGPGHSHCHRPARGNAAKERYTMQVDCTPQGGESASGATMADWALGYGGMGVAVFPVHTPLNTLGACSCNKAECSDAGKHPRTARGWKDASTDERQIRAWWEQWPEANIGLATGKISNAFGFDIDDGDEGLAEVARYGGLPEGPRARTGRGLHAYFVWPGFAVPNGVKKSGTWGRAFAHCDLRGDGGYTILPPSMHKSGVRYGWIGDCPTSVGDFPAAPDWLLDKITACVEERAEKARWARESVGKGGGDGSFDAALAERILDKYIRMVMEDGNERNISGFHMAEQLRDNGVPYQAAFPYMRRYQQAVEHLKDHPYSWDEATRSTDSAYQGRAPREPWATHGGEDGEGIGRWGALRYAEEYGREMRYVPVHKRWFVWTGAYWQHDRVEAHLRRGIELVGKLYAEAGDPARQDTGTKRKAAQRRVGKLDTAGGIRGMVGLAAACAEIAAPAEAFDRDPWLATVANGTLDLRLDRSPDNGASALLRPHAQADLLTRRLGKGRAGIAYQPTAVCPQ